MSKKIERHGEICDYIKDVYKRKNEDYGDSVGQLYEKLGDISLLTRISDKYNRILNIVSTQNECQVSDETIDDTILDMANYCIIWLMEREMAKKKDIETADELYEEITAKFRKQL